MEKKLTDDEIVKALNWCGTSMTCKGCPKYCGEVYVNYHKCKGDLMEQSIDLNHRLQDEKKDMHQDLIQAEKYAEKLSIENARQKAEIERLTAFKNEAISLSLYGKGHKDGKEVAVKDTVKEILKMSDEINKGGQNDLCELEVAIKERYGVEVE